MLEHDSGSVYKEGFCAISLSAHQKLLAGVLTEMTKLFLFAEEVKAEFSHPVRINFFAASSISLLLLSFIYHDISMGLSAVLWYVGAILQTFFTFYVIPMQI